jgi:hypothetical protein
MTYIRPLIVGVATLAFAYSAFSAALATIASPANPQLALRFSPNNPVAHAIYGDRLATQGAEAGVLRLLESHAKASLLAQAVNPRALRQLSVAVANGNNDTYRIGLLKLSEKMSRREIGTQILLIEYGAKGDGIAETLRHYDIALTTNEEVKATLFPILASAIEDPAINKSFAPYLASGRIWVPEFISYKFGRDKQSNSLAIASLASRDEPSFPEFKIFKKLFFDRALRTDQIDTAREFNARFQVADPALLTSAVFAPSLGERSAAAEWQLFELPYALPQFVQEKIKAPPRLNLVASSGARGLIASKLLVLRPDRYRLTVRYGNVVLVTGTSLNWSLKCLNDPTFPVVWQSSSIPVAGKQDVQLLNVPQSCKAQSLDLIISAAGDQSDSTIDVVSVDLAPASNLDTPSSAKNHD